MMGNRGTVETQCRFCVEHYSYFMPYIRIMEAQLCGFLFQYMGQENDDTWGNEKQHAQ